MMEVAVVKKLISIAERLDEKMDLICGGCNLSTKSIMGIFNMNLPGTFTLRIHESGRKAKNIMGHLENIQ